MINPNEIYHELQKIFWGTPDNIGVLWMKPKRALIKNSMTIASITALGFSLMVIPFTLEKTTLGALKPGDMVNIETDIIFRWLAERYSQTTNKNGSDNGDESFSPFTSIYKED